jgi:molybdopterin/thiamine biosynthesis adenylyltransferase
VTNANSNAHSGLSHSEFERYRRQVEGDLGVQGQLRLKRARAIVIGAGAAGSAAAAQLVSCGVGYVAVVDGGQVALSDLVGQAVYYSPDVGRSKADTLAAKLGLLNPEVLVESYPVALDDRNAAAIVADHDLVLDCTHDAPSGAALDGTGATVLRASGAHPTTAVAGATLAAEALRALSRPAAEALT